jgi:hypothetical protein
MKTLGISESTLCSESLSVRLFWPAVANGSDVDYLGAQGYWICVLVAIVSFVFWALTDNPIIGVFIFLYFYLGGCGVRERSRYAAAAVFLMYALGTLFAVLVSGRILAVFGLLTALLLANLRATWIAANWKPAPEEAFVPERRADTFGAVVADKLPSLLWPKVRNSYYLFSSTLLLYIGWLTLISARTILLSAYATDLILAVACSWPFFFVLFWAIRGTARLKHLLIGLPAGMFGAFVAGAIATPKTDIAQMTLYSLPMIGLYVVSIVIAWFHPINRGERAEEQMAISAWLPALAKMLVGLLIIPWGLLLIPWWIKRWEKPKEKGKAEIEENQREQRITAGDA